MIQVKVSVDSDPESWGEDVSDADGVELAEILASEVVAWGEMNGFAIEADVYRGYHTRHIVTTHATQECGVAVLDYLCGAGMQRAREILEERKFGESR